MDDDRLMSRPAPRLVILPAAAVLLLAVAWVATSPADTSGAGPPAGTGSGGSSAGHSQLLPARGEQTGGEPEVAAVTPVPAVQDLVAQVDRGRALHDLQLLSGEAPICFRSVCERISNRLTGSAGLALAVDYILEQTASLGYQVTVQNWRRGPYADRNVILRREGVLSPTEEVYFVAHVDGVGIRPNGRYPAADDNGSGTVAGLELARVLSTVRTARTVLILFSTGEEQNMQGVYAYLERLSADQLAAIRYLVNLDMVGYDGNGDRVMELYYGEHGPSQALAGSIRQLILAYEPDLVPRLNSECG